MTEQHGVKYSMLVHDRQHYDYPTRASVTVEGSGIAAHIRALIVLLQATSFHEQTIREGLREVLEDMDDADKAFDRA